MGCLTTEERFGVNAFVLSATSKVHNSCTEEKLLCQIQGAYEWRQEIQPTLLIY